MSESTATAWIIERLEVENSKMEEEMENVNSCEDGFAASGVEYDVELVYGFGSFDESV